MIKVFLTINDDIVQVLPGTSMLYSLSGLIAMMVRMVSVMYLRLNFKQLVI